MKPFLFILIFLIHFTTYAQSQQPAMADSVKTFLDKSLQILQQNAINRDSVDWNALKTKVYQKAAGARSYEDVLPIYPYLFEQIDDHHGALKYKGKSYYWKGTAAPYHNRVVLSAVKKYSSVTVQKIGKHAGYILLPGNNDFNGKNINEEAKAIREAIASINSKKIKGWIIDLRINTGGSMYEMLAGLGNLLGDGEAGGFVDQHQKPEGSWIIKKGNIYLDTAQVSNVASVKPAKRKNIPIAVLLSGQTASSGEIVAISTVGRPNTIRIGENSAGYTTGNKGFQINGQAGLNLAVDFDTDRTGRIYRNQVSPEIRVTGGDNFENLEVDQKVKAALDWLKKR
ncbi:MAG: S41 family peptidase [Janthinobacterium lividum]